MYSRIVDASWNFKTANTKEFTHCYHAYPAMMIPQVARSLIELFAPQDKCNLIFDPYMGSGTSLVEASLKGINSIGTDINPLARLISHAKTTHFNIQKINLELSEIQLFPFSYSDDKVKNTDFTRVSNSSFWYSQDVLLKLSFISQFIDALDNDVKLFFQIALSETVRDVSYTRNGEFKRFRMAEKQIKQFKPDVFGIFESKVFRNLKGLKQYNLSKHSAEVRICDFNTVIGIPEDILSDNSVDMIITSPPYGDSHTTVAYGQFSRWANEWFEFPYAKNLDNLLMGGKKKAEPYYETVSIEQELREIQSIDNKRFQEVVSFLNDYSSSINNIAPKIRKGGVICYVVGNRTVKGIQIPLDYFTAEMFEKQGFNHLKTIVREIPNKRMPSKNSPTNVSGAKGSTMSNEYIVVMRKEK
ncbi:MAG: DNA methyltransferase [Bacteroidales bacterium]|nr:DNA methyltransferase [Bacteroidales bacterium]